MSSIHFIDEDAGHTLEMEFVPNLKRPKEIYVVIDGQRVAYRGHDERWIPMTTQPQLSIIRFSPVMRRTK